MRNDKPWQDVKTFDFKKHDTFGTYKYSKYTFKLAKKPGENGFDQAYITIDDEEEEYMLNGSVAHGSPTQEAVNFIKGFLAGRCLPKCWDCNIARCPFAPNALATLAPLLLRSTPTGVCEALSSADLIPGSWPARASRA